MCVCGWVGLWVWVCGWWVLSMGWVKHVLVPVFDGEGAGGKSEGRRAEDGGCGGTGHKLSSTLCRRRKAGQKDGQRDYCRPYQNPHCGGGGCGWGWGWRNWCRVSSAKSFSALRHNWQAVDDGVMMGV